MSVAAAWTAFIALVFVTLALLAANAERRPETPTPVVTKTVYIERATEAHFRQE